jgi:hypothetical protein
VPNILPEKKTVGDNGKNERKKKDFFFLSFPFPVATELEESQGAFIDMIL